MHQCRSEHILIFVYSLAATKYYRILILIFPLLGLTNAGGGGAHASQKNRALLGTDWWRISFGLWDLYLNLSLDIAGEC